MIFKRDSEMIGKFVRRIEKKGTIKSMSNYLLIHGAAEGGWCWHRVKKTLEGMGHTVIAPDLPGNEAHSNIPATEITLDRYVRYVIDCVKSSNGKVVLVGHSFGGAVITRAINDMRGRNIEKAIYVCAIVPQNGDVARSILDSDTGSELKKAFKMNQEKTCVELIPEIIDEVIFNGCSAEDIQYAKERIVPQPVMPLSVPIILEKNDGVRRIGIVCRKDKSLTPALQEKMYANAKCEIKYLDSGHAPFFSKAEELSRIVTAE
jgi:pimeloyl-ACP methyl ester carboxylesterase